MKLGSMLPTHCTGEYRVPAETIRWWAREATDAGFHGLWVLDHLVKPETYRTSLLDPLIALSHAAAVAPEANLGTSILIAPLRHTANIASQALSIQHLTEGQVTLGLGAGYVPKEFEVTGVPRTERGPRVSEAVSVLNQLFDGETSFSGRFHEFENVRIDPVLDTPPKLLAGGSSIVDEDGNRRIPRPILDRILNCGGWLARPTNPEKLEAEWELITDYAREQGVDPDSLRRVMLQYIHVVDTDDREAAHREQKVAYEDFLDGDRNFDYAKQYCLTGTPADIQADLDAVEAIGFDEVILGQVVHTPADLEQQLGLLTDTFLDA
ncbi:LLM class flavin-dependent oxidoreductase [Haladaptatus sp. DJG-WS-42]|uniref:LLM class flavin-dependent oxidoreductase n=1 Tax=Haladaptatus sp. DJG-WS-42 TaxID=3120516 RepID=UPI0030D05871